MSTRKGDLSASMAILGLLAQQPDTAVGIGIRLVELFPHAHWSRTTVHNNLPSLISQGLVRLVDKGNEPSFSRYETTTAGAGRFRAWLHQSTTLSPTVRDALQGRMAFVERDELASLIEMVRQSEDAYRMEFAAAQGRVKTVTRSMRRSQGTVDWRAKLQFIQSGDEALLLGLMLRRLQRLGDELETLLEECSAADRSRG